jgi:hypothetical protein
MNLADAGSFAVLDPQVSAALCTHRTLFQPLSNLHPAFAAPDTQGAEIASTLAPRT